MHNYEIKPSLNKKQVVIVGARGYSGLELARICLKHPAIELAACYVSSNDFLLSDYLDDAKAKSVAHPSISEISNCCADVVFLATPADVSMKLAPALIAKNKMVIDLSGAFRLKGKTPADTSSLFKKWYGEEHPCPELVHEAEYGLVPWSAPFKSKLISNPGCYATSVLMAVIPLIRSGLIDTQSLVIDAKSGATGAGRKAAENLLFTEVDGECLPYKVGAHQHLPEITQYAESFAGAKIDPFFTTHLLGARRGILSSIYAKTSHDTKAIDQAFKSAYESYTLADCAVLESKGPKAQYALSLKRISGSPKTKIRYQVSNGKLFAFCTIDNLLKGAASQAIENFNRLADLPITTGLTNVMTDLEPTL